MYKYLNDEKKIRLKECALTRINGTILESIEKTYVKKKKKQKIKYVKKKETKTNKYLQPNKL